MDAELGDDWADAATRSHAPRSVTGPPASTTVLALNQPTRQLSRGPSDEARQPVLQVARTSSASAARQRGHAPIVDVD